MRVDEHGAARFARRRQAGNVLVLFALCAFGLLAVAALVIDVGLARVAQVQMQTSADAGALEGVRARDGDPDGQVDYAALPDDDARDSQRRERVRDLVARAADPDMDLSTTTGEERVQGAGAAVDLTGGLGGATQASLDLDVEADPSGRFYRPDLQENPANEVHGDQLAGSWDPAQVDHGEDRDYTRIDLTPAAPGGTASLAAEGYLVRLRRTPDLDGLDAATGVSSNGGPLPLLFGRGAPIPDAPSSTGHAYRPHGITVRATAIAQAQPAVRVGPAVPALNLEGLALTLDRGTWEGLPVAPAASIAGDPAWLTPEGSSAAVGDAAPTTGAPAALPPAGYVAITEGGLVVGFGRVALSGTTGAYTLVRTASPVAARNASAVASSTAQRASLAAVSHQLLAPALVR